MYPALGDAIGHVYREINLCALRERSALRVLYDWSG